MSAACCHVDFSIGVDFKRLARRVVQYQKAGGRAGRHSRNLSLCRYFAYILWGRHWLRLCIFSINPWACRPVGDAFRDRSLPHAAPGAGLRQGAGGSRAYGRGGSPRLPEGRPREKRRNRINSGRSRLPPGHTTGIFAKNRQARWKKTRPAESQSYNTVLGKRFSGIGLFRRVKGCGETPNRRRERWRKTQP